MKSSLKAGNPASNFTKPLGIFKSKRRIIHDSERRAKYRSIGRRASPKMVKNSADSKSNP